jgi:hypothetical protein
LALELMMPAMHPATMTASTIRIQVWLFMPALHQT